jgi:hypothetical protein
VAENHPRAYPHASSMAYVDQIVVGLCLTVETRARRPKCRMPAGLTAKTEELYDVIGRSRLYNNLRNQPIRTCIRGKPHQIDCSVEDILLSQEAG